MSSLYNSLTSSTCNINQEGLTDVLKCCIKFPLGCVCVGVHEAGVNTVFILDSPPQDSSLSWETLAHILTLKVPAPLQR